jgi:predicted nicotinamide N-methyase
MRKSSAAGIARRAFVLRHTRVRRLPHLPDVRLYLADDIMTLWQLTAAEAGGEDVPPPYWAFAWLGGQAIARYLLDHRGEVTGKRVVDFATGSGLCAIAAMHAGAAHVLAADIDPFSAVAVVINARVNRVHIDFTDRNLLDAEPPEADVILAGDTCYEEPLAGHVLAWLKVAHNRGIRVLIGDPGRAYFPREGLIRLASCQIPTTRELEGMTVRATGIFTFAAD